MSMLRRIVLALAVVLVVAPFSDARRRGRRNPKTRPMHRSSPAFSATAAINADRLDVVAPVAYHRKTIEKHRRRMLEVGERVEVTVDEMNMYKRMLADDSASEPWLTWEDAEDQGSLQPLRTAFVTEFFDGSDDMLTAAETCVVAGQIVQQNKMDSANIAGSGSSQACQSDEVVSNLTQQVVNLRLDWVQQYLSDTFSVKRALNGITLQSSTQAGYPFDGNENGPVDGEGNLLCNTTLAGQCPPIEYPDADLVIVVTLHPLSQDKSGIAGYASCQQSDQYGRCTVGYFEWVPSTLSVSEFLYPDVAMLERATALHECMHVLGAVKNSQVFRDPDTGAGQPNSYKLLIQQESQFIPKQIALWITPGVVEMAREQFGCPNMTGVPLEDLPSGANGHWESRLMGSEVMSYGLTTGEYYVSMLTLQFFEDTYQYQINFTAGTQRIYEASGSDSELAADIFTNIFASSEDTGIVRENRTWPTGYQRWGRNAGCDFVMKYPSAETWGDRYFCSEPSTNMCTADNRMSGRCSLYQYGADYNAASTSWYTQSDTPSASWYAQVTGGSISTSLISNDQYPALPSDYQYLTTILDSTYGGFLSAMDYAPVVTGQVSCLDAEPSPGALKFAIDEVEWTGDDSDWVDFSSEIQEYGGQIYSDRSRCFRSSLLLYTESALVLTDTTVVQKAGLCYLANCYTENYLQIGVKTVLGGTKWFRCENESNIYVAGFIGAFECPDPTDFCAYEDITGVKYAENNETLEWVFWGVLLGVILICFLVFCCCRKARSVASRRIKELMNFELIFKTAKRAPREGKSPASYFLMGVSVIWVIIGVVSILVGIVSILADADTYLWENADALVFHFIGLGLVIIVLAVLGIMAAQADRQTLKAAFYLYINMFLLIGFVFLSVITLGIPSWLEIIVEIAWEQLYLYFPNEWQVYSAAQAWQLIWEWYQEQPYIVWIIVAWNAFSMIGGMICTFIMLTFRNVLGTMLFWMNCIILIAGVAFVVCCYVLIPILPTDWLVGLFLAGCFTVVAGGVGVFVCRREKVLIGWIAFTAVALVTMITMGAFLVEGVDENTARVANLSSEALADVVSRLSFVAGEWTETSLKQFLDSNVLAAAIAQLILALVIAATIGAGALVLKDVREVNHEKEVAEAGHKQDYARKRGGRKKEWERAHSAGAFTWQITHLSSLFAMLNDALSMC